MQDTETVERRLTLDDLRANPGALLRGTVVDRLLDVGPSTRLRWTAEGRLPSVRVGASYRYVASHVLEAIESGALAIRNGGER